MIDLKAQIRDGTWWTVTRVAIFTRSLFTFECAMFLFFAAGAHGLIVPLAGPTSTDFVSFYAAGTLVDAGHAASAYDQVAHRVAEEHATQPGIAYNFFYYPPTFLLLCGLLGAFPYLVAFYAFQVITLVPCLIAAKTILPRAGILGLMAFPAVFWTMGTGQNAFLTAGLMAGATLLLDRSPFLAGALFGALCYKPHFGLLIPVALIAGSHWRAIWGAATSVLGLVAASLVLFGCSTWQAFLNAAAQSQPVYASHMIDMAGLTTPFGAIMTLGGDPMLAFSVQAAASLIVAGIVAYVWRHGASLPVRAAVLIAGTAVAVPIVMFYDLMLDGIAIAWLLRAGQTADMPPWHRSAIAVLFLLPMLSGNLGEGSNLLLPPITALGCFVLAVSQFCHEGGLGTIKLRQT